MQPMKSRQEKGRWAGKKKKRSQKAGHDTEHDSGDINNDPSQKAGGGGGLKRRQPLLAGVRKREPRTQKAPEKERSKNMKEACLLAAQKSRQEKPASWQEGALHKSKCNPNGSIFPSTSLPPSLPPQFPPPLALLFCVPRIASLRPGILAR